MKKLIKSLGEFFQRLFKEVEYLLKRYAVPTIEVLQVVKKLLDSQLPIRLADLTNTKWDNILIEKMNDAIPKALMKLELAQCVTDNTDPDAVVSCAFEKLKGMGIDLQETMIGDIAYHIVFILADGKMSKAECRLAVEYWYRKYYKQSM